MTILRADMPIDVQNEALKSIASQEARDLDRLRADFGEDRVVLLGFATPGGLELSAGERAAVAAVVDSLRARSELVADATLAPGRSLVTATVVPQRDVALGRDGVTAAERIVELARAACPATLDVRATGAALLERAVADALHAERGVVVPAVALVMVAVLWLFYRRVRVVLVVLTPAFVAIATTGGLMALAGHRLDPIATLLDPVLLTVGVACGVHAVEAFVRQRRWLAAEGAAVAARRSLWSPMVWSTATTMIGFVTLAATEIPAVATFGVYAAFGVALVGCAAFWCVPIWLAAALPSWNPTARRGLGWLGFAVWIGKHRRRILFGAAATMLALAAGLPSLRVDNDPLRLLAPDDATRLEHSYLARELGGVETIGLRVPADSRANDPGWLALLCSLILDRHDDVVVQVPAARRTSDGDLLLEFVIAPAGSTARERMFAAIDAEMADFGFPELRVLGSPVQIARDSGRLVRGQLYGLAIALPLLAAAVACALRSVRLGLLSLLPNAAPPLAIYGVLAWSGRPLSVATVMIGAAMLGLIVDDTIHLLHHFAAAIRSGQSRRRAVAHAIERAGRAISVTTIVLGLGLGSGVLGSLTTTVEFSLLAAATIGLAWLLDLLVLPALLRASSFWLPSPAVADRTPDQDDESPPPTATTLTPRCLTPTTC